MVVLPFAARSIFMSLPFASSKSYTTWMIKASSIHLAPAPAPAPSPVNLGIYIYLLFEIILHGYSSVCGLTVIFTSQFQVPALLPHHDSVIIIIIIIIVGK